MAKKDIILVVGSINMDLVVRTATFPGPGQTVLGENFQTSPGGKGANQAAAIAKLGGRCYMIGRVGKDDFGSSLLTSLQVQGVDCSAVGVCADCSTGTAMIIVDSNGENSIVVDRGANGLMTPDDDIFPNEGLFERASLVLLQMELPVVAIRAAMDLARRHGCQIMLDPAPAAPAIPQDLYMVDYFLPNQTEAELITGNKVRDAREDKLAASDMIARGAKCVVLKLGPRGSLVVAEDGHIYTIPPYRVEVVDTTAAGDAFAGALALALSRGERIREAATMANAAGALACTKMGAQGALPTADEVAILMQDQILA